MTKSILPFLFVALSGVQVATAQTKPKPKTPVKKTTASVAAKPTATKAPGLKNLQDSVSYAFGMRIAQSFKKDMQDANGKALIEGMKSVFESTTPLLQESKLDSIIALYSEQEERNAARPAIEAGEAFLAANKAKAGVFTTASGLQYEIIKTGTGIKPKATDTIVCHYKGTLLDGTVFDESYGRNEPLTIVLDRVISGWTEGVQLMNAGSKYKFFIPYQLGYKLRNAGAIPAGSMLIFEIELLEVKKAG